MQLRYNTNITINRLGAEVREVRYRWHELILLFILFFFFFKWEEKVYDNLAQLAGVKRTKLGADDKEDFSLAWIQTSKKSD